MGYDVLCPVEYQRANNRPPEYTTSYIAQVTSSLRFPLPPQLIDILSGPSLPKKFLRCLRPQVIDWAMPFLLLPHPSLTFIGEKPSLPMALGSLEVNEKLKSVSLFEHSFRAKALLEKDLLIIAGLHPIEDNYTSPESFYSRLHVPSSVRARSPSETPELPSSAPPGSVPLQLLHSLVIIDSPTPLILPLEIGPSSQKRPHIKEPSLEDILPHAELAQIATFHATVLSPQL
ncbi:hypothetical protein Salat_2132100 [Sesamum alatum]|uniref:Uncharacterized protein n=1 Tax=Sesamum alatum TaxID=300844 RepID=A0AAE1Y176_9LAMI|nr:hypothetical protein Salat_2132100 [Sesamum alatum]